MKTKNCSSRCIREKSCLCGTYILIQLPFCSKYYLFFPLLEGLLSQLFFPSWKPFSLATICQGKITTGQPLLYPFHLSPRWPVHWNCLYSEKKPARHFTLRERERTEAAELQAATCFLRPLVCRPAGPFTGGSDDMAKVSIPRKGARKPSLFPGQAADRAGHRLPVTVAGVADW